MVKNNNDNSTYSEWEEERIERLSNDLSLLKKDIKTLVMSNLSLDCYEKLKEYILFSMEITLCLISEQIILHHVNGKEFNVDVFLEKYLSDLQMAIVDHQKKVVEEYTKFERNQK